MKDGFRLGVLRLLAASWICALASPAMLLAQAEYKSADEAFSAGVKLLRDKQEQASIAPFEAALALAPDDAYRVRVYTALQNGYRTLPEADKMVEASEYLIEHAETPLSRSSQTRSLVGFLFQRGKLDYAVERYEGRLKTNPDDLAALGALAQLYERQRKNPERAAELNARLAAIEKQLAQVRAAKLEQDAAFAPQLAGTYWKDAALAWLDAGDKQRARNAAEQALAAGPDARSELLAHFWYRALGDVFLTTGAPQQAIPQYEAAIKLTTIDGYIKDCKAKLAEAEAAVKAAPK
jgi:tetratricopeptide (TPR) repeat protein